MKQKELRRAAIKENENLKQELKDKYISPYSLQSIMKQTPNEEANDIDEFQVMTEKALAKGSNMKDYIFSLFSRKIFAEIYFAWSKDCNEPISVESAKYFRDELLLRNNKDQKNYNFRSLRVGKNFLLAFVGNLDGTSLQRVELPDNMITDTCMHNIKSLISAKKVEYLNLASNMISTEGLKIVQNELMKTESLRYLNFGILEGSFRRNNFTGDGGLVLARILLDNNSIETLILQDNELGEDSGDKIGASLIQNRRLKKLRITDNKIKNRGARSIILNGERLSAIDLSNNDITSDVCVDIKQLIETSGNLVELTWDGNNIGLKGIQNIVEALEKSQHLKILSLKNTNIEDIGIQMLAEGLRTNTLLESLDLGSNSMKYDSFIDICDCLNLNKIKHFYAKNNLLGDESMKYFAETILNQESTSCLKSFDFSSCKIYDQGLIYILNELTNNEKITKIKLRDNYFSHEIDYVVLDFIEKNHTLTYLDLNKNRFSFQCLQKLQKIIERNKQFQSDKEPNKLLVELYSLKYENTKLNERKDILKFIENDVEKLRSNRNDLRQDYETFKDRCDDQVAEIQKMVDKTRILYAMKEKEYTVKQDILEDLKKSNTAAIEKMTQKINELKEKKALLEKENERIKISHASMEQELTSKIRELYDKIDDSKKKEAEFSKEAKIYAEEVFKLDKIIKEKQNILKL